MNSNWTFTLLTLLTDIAASVGRMREAQTASQPPPSHEMEALHQRVDSLLGEYYDKLRTIEQRWFHPAQPSDPNKKSDA